MYKRERGSREENEYGENSWMQLNVEAKYKPALSAKSYQWPW